MAVAITPEMMWVIGIFEGEGSMDLRERAGHRFPWARVQIGMTDRDILERVQSITGLGNIRERNRANRPENWKTLYEWDVNGARALELITLWLPHLGQRRAAKAQEIIDRERRAREERAHPERSCVECGATFVPAKYAAQRFCQGRCRDNHKQRRLRKKWIAEGKVRTPTGYAFPAPGAQRGTRPDHAINGKRITSQDIDA